MFETITLFVASFLALFFTIDVIGVAPIFVSLTAQSTLEQRKDVAKKGVLVATAILLFFGLSGSGVLDILHISLAAFRIAGGILLLILSIDMVLAKPEFSLRKDPATEKEKTEPRDDISVFPLAIPLLSGPAAITMLILFMKEASGNPLNQGVILLALFINMLICWTILHFSVAISKYLGRTGINVLNRIFGILLTALACQFFIDGITEAFFKD